jgi:hypothetical protein
MVYMVFSAGAPRRLLCTDYHKKTARGRTARTTWLSPSTNILLLATNYSLTCHFDITPICGGQPVSIHIACPSCGWGGPVADQLRGQSVRCTQCGATFSALPVPASAGSTLVRSANQGCGFAAGSMAFSLAMVPVFVVVGVAGIVLMLCLCTGLMALFDQRSPSTPSTAVDTPKHEMVQEKQ